MRPQLVGLQGETVARRASAAFLWPWRATSAPASTHPRPSIARAGHRNVSTSARGHDGGPSVRRPHREALQDQPLGRSLRSRRCAMPSAPLRLSLDRDSLGTYRRNGRVRTPATPVATTPNHADLRRSEQVVNAISDTRMGYVGRVASRFRDSNPLSSPRQGAVIRGR